jgi:hypothetical protein
MALNPFNVTKAEGFNHSYEQLASLMQFKVGVADVLLNNTNVFIEGSRGSGKSMYLRLLSTPVKAYYERLAKDGRVEPLPNHRPYVGIYVKLTPTIFSKHEYEGEPGFRETFQQLFNIYCAEHIVNGICEAQRAEICTLSIQEVTVISDKISRTFALPGSGGSSFVELFEALRSERTRTRHALNVKPYSTDQRGQPDILWHVAEMITTLGAFREQRVHLLVDEYDSLSEVQQKIINTYLRKRDFPLTFKIACKKHRLTLEDVEGKPLNPSGDFERIELDDDDFGNSTSFKQYVASIADRRLGAAGISTHIRSLLGTTRREHKPKTERQYSGFDMTATLSSGIVRTFLELCRDMYSRVEYDENQIPKPLAPSVQDDVIKRHASNRWTALARDYSARRELQHMIEQVAKLFHLKSQTAEKQVIRLEIVDFDRLSSFMRSLLEQALEYEALVQPNRERLQKNSVAASRGYLLHRLLCVHFRLEPHSRWDAEISANQLERLVLGPPDAIKDVIRRPTRRDRETHHSRDAPSLFQSRHCPILDQPCPTDQPVRGSGFLSCRLPPAGKIRDAATLLKDAFKCTVAGGEVNYEIRTAEDYPPMGDIACKVCRAISETEFVLAEMSRLSPSVAMELGLAIARKRPAYILFNTDEQPSVPQPFSSLEYLSYPITPDGVKKMVELKLVPFLSDFSHGRGQVRIGLDDPLAVPEPKGVFIAVPGTDYHQRTLLPKLRDGLERAGLGPVITEQDGQALQDLQRAAIGIANAKYCLIDTTGGAPTRAMYLGIAQGYRKRFANLIDAEESQGSPVFTNARSKSEIDYRGFDELIAKIGQFLSRFGEKL